MFDKWMKYSYAAQKSHRYRLLKIFLFFAALVVLYNVITSFFISIWVLDNGAMQSGLASGDRLVLVSFALPSLLNRFSQDDREPPFKRGNIVLVDNGRREKTGVMRKIVDGVLRFFTAQQVSLFDKKDRLYLKRVIGLPGDEITMTNFVLRVKPAGSAYSLTEFELADKPYYPTIPHVPALWDESIPFSGNMDRVTLGSGECFVISDDRSNTNDSRTWGPVPVELISARAVFRFWPLTKIGRP
jgi:signal peptidase I